MLFVRIHAAYATIASDQIADLTLRYPKYAFSYNLRLLLCFISVGLKELNMYSLVFYTHAAELTCARQTLA